MDCVPCANCPIGQGLSVPCGSKVSNDSKIECVFCEPNKTFSDKHGKGHCKTCQDCGLRNMIKECTINHNRECGKTCPKGYEFDINIDDCVKVESMMPTPTTTYFTKTVKLETSRKEITETQSETEAYEVTTTASSPSVKVKINSSQPLKENYDSANVWSTNKVQPGQDHKTLLTINYVLIALVIVFAPTILVLVIVIVHKKRQDHSTPRDEESTGKILTLKNWSKIVLVSPLVLPSGN